MNIRIEFRYAVLSSLLTLLWLCTEYLIGLQDKYIAIYPYVTFFAFIIPVICIRLALLEKTELLFQKISFKQAFFCGLLLTVFATIFCVPIQIAFLKLINIDFLDNMAAYATEHGKQPKELAQMYYTPGFYITGSVIITFITGAVVSLILARLMRTK